jgi:hypothetical protein
MNPHALRLGELTNGRQPESVRAHNAQGPTLHDLRVVHPKVDAAGATMTPEIPSLAGRVVLQDKDPKVARMDDTRSRKTQRFVRALRCSHVPSRLFASSYGTVMAPSRKERHLAFLLSARLRWLRGPVTHSVVRWNLVCRWRR